jgi:hypothetical protein
MMYANKLCWFSKRLAYEAVCGVIMISTGVPTKQLVEFVAIRTFGNTPLQ